MNVHIEIFEFFFILLWRRRMISRGIFRYSLLLSWSNFATSSDIVINIDTAYIHDSLLSLLLHFFSAIGVHVLTRVHNTTARVRSLAAMLHRDVAYGAELRACCVCAVTHVVTRRKRHR